MDEDGNHFRLLCGLQRLLEEITFRMITETLASPNIPHLQHRPQLFSCGSFSSQCFLKEPIHPHRPWIAPSSPDLLVLYTVIQLRCHLLRKPSGNALYHQLGLVPPSAFPGHLVQTTSQQILPCNDLPYPAIISPDTFFRGRGQISLWARLWDSMLHTVGTWPVFLKIPNLFLQPVWNMLKICGSHLLKTTFIGKHTFWVKVNFDMTFVLTNVHLPRLKISRLREYFSIGEIRL